MKDGTRTVEAVPREGAATWPAARVVADLVELTKPRIGAFVVLAALTGALLASGPEGSLARALLAAVLVGAVAASSCVFNQVLERDVDRLMTRTADRPLPAGRLGVAPAVLFGAALGVAGTVGLALEFNVLTALLGLSTLVAYVVLYTPLKRHTSFNTVVGAVPGAMPPLLGWVAVSGAPAQWGWTLFAILFAWQFPHFLAIAWLHRDDYRRAGMKMLPALPGAEGLAGRQAWAYSLLLVPVSLLPAVRGDADLVYVAAALVLGLAYAAASLLFALRETRRRARAVLLVSLAYLPLILTAALLDSAVGRALRF